MWRIALGIGLLLLGLFVAVIVCSRMNDPLPRGGTLVTPRHPRRGDLQEDPLDSFDV